MPDADGFQRTLEAMVADGDSLMAKKQFAEAARAYSECADFVRTMRKLQEPVREGGPTDVPLDHRVLYANRLLIVPLHRLARARYRLGDYLAARQCLREIVVLLEEFTDLAGGSTKKEGARMLESARQELREADAGRFDL